MAAATARIAGVAITIASAATSGVAHAETTHVLSAGQTVDGIARRYHVTARAILDANGIKHPERIRAGETLIIPKDGDAPAAPGQKGKPVSYATRSSHPGVVRLTRLGTTEKFVLRVRDTRGRVPSSALSTAEKVLRHPSSATHAIDPRLVAMLGIVSDHFGGRAIEVVSGYRPFTPTQFTAHSNHNHGRAVDFRVTGVPNEVVRDFCRTLRKAGCGYYPNSTFVHIDARETSAFWIDFSKPGERPRYEQPGHAADADEGAGDVSATESANTAPPETSEPAGPLPTDTPTPLKE